MSDDTNNKKTEPTRITVVSRDFTAAALEFHRGRLAAKGYKIESKITEQQFHLIEMGTDEKGDPLLNEVELFDGDMLHAVTFIKKDVSE